MARHLSAIGCCAWLCVLCGALFGEESATIGSRPSAFLITDYFPPAIYEGDTLTACFRIENAASTGRDFEVAANAVDAAGADVKGHVEKAGVPTGAFAPVKFEFDSKHVARVRFDLKVSGDTAILASENLVLLRDDDVWPATKCANGRIVLADVENKGAIVIPVVQKKRAIDDRTFAPMKWVLGSSSDDNLAKSGKAAVFVPGAWSLKTDGAHALGPWPLNGSTPILNAIDTIFSQLRNATVGEFKRVIVVLPPEDLDLATDPRTYRVALDALQARLAKLGVVRIVLLSPFKYGCNDAHRKALWREIHESAKVNASKVVDPLDWMAEDAWRADPSVPKVHAQRPNADGRKMIEQALADLIK